MPHPPSHPAVRLEAAGLRRYLRAMAGFQRNVKLFLTVTAFRGMLIATQSTILNLYLYSLGYDARFIGVINATSALAVLLVSVPFGYLADHVGRRALLLSTGLLYPLTMLGIALAHSTALILLFMFLFGAVSAGYWVAGVPLLYAHTSAAERVHAFSVNSFLLWGVGPAGAFLGGQVVEIAARTVHVSASSSVALRWGMFFIVALSVAGAIPYLFLRETRPTGQAESETPPPARSIARLAAMLLLPDVVLAFGVGAVLTFGQLYFHLRFHLDPGPIGIIMALGGVIGGVGTLSTPLLARRWGNLRTTVRLQWMQVPLMTTLALAHLLVLAMPAYWLVITVRGMADPVYNAFIQERVPERYRSRLTGMYSVTYSIGFSLGPALSGALQKAGGFTPAFLMGMACYFVGSLLLYLFFGRSAPRPRTVALTPEL